MSIKIPEYKNEGRKKSGRKKREIGGEMRTKSEKE